MRHYGLDKIEVASAGYLRRRKLTAVRSAALAAEIVAPLISGDMDHVFCLTAGQASQLDFLTAMMAGWSGDGIDCISVWTWAVADYELLAIEEAATIGHAAGASLRFILDRSCLDRRAALIVWLQERFGGDCLRATVSHAKLATVRTRTGRVCTIRGSMNLNFNQRNEQADICTSREVYDVVRAAEDAVWAAYREIGKDMLGYSACDDRMHAAAGSEKTAVARGARKAPEPVRADVMAEWFDD